MLKIDKKREDRKMETKTRIRKDDTLRTKYRVWARTYPNFITPHIIGLSQIGSLFIELSEGTDFNNKALYGVSAFRWNETENTFKRFETPYTNCYYSNTEARKQFRSAINYYNAHYGELLKESA